MKRREFIGLVGGAAAWPVGAKAQQATMASIGFLGLGKLEDARRVFDAIRPGLAQLGYVENQNLAVQFRCADYHDERLPALATELVQSRVTAIIAPTGPSVSAARGVTQSIPIIFFTGFDPIERGFVTSLNRPGGNLTGVFTLNPDLMLKRLEVLHELVPAARSVGLLEYAYDVSIEAAAMELKAVELQLNAAATAFGIQLLIQRAAGADEFGQAIETLAGQHAGAILVSQDAVFTNNRDQLVALIARRGIPAIYPIREFSEAGALVSYGTNYPDAYRQVGVYVGRVLKGEKPADLPVQQVTKIELVINLKTAKSLGLIVPQTLLGRADGVIE
jgi:putative ABC transport system substrate-binding protein